MIAPQDIPAIVSYAQRQLAADLAGSHSEPGASQAAHIGATCLATIAGLNAHRHGLHAFCPRCERWSVLNPKGW